LLREGRCDCAAQGRNVPRSLYKLSSFVSYPSAAFSGSFKTKIFSLNGWALARHVSFQNRRQLTATRSRPLRRVQKQRRATVGRKRSGIQYRDKPTYGSDTALHQPAMSRTISTFGIWHETSVRAKT